MKDWNAVNSEELREQSNRSTPFQDEPTVPAPRDDADTVIYSPITPECAPDDEGKRPVEPEPMMEQERPVESVQLREPRIANERSRSCLLFL